MVHWFVEGLVSANLQVWLAALFTFGTYAHESIVNVGIKLQKLKRNLKSVQTETILNDEQRALAWEDLAYEACDLLDEIEIAVSKPRGTNALSKISLAISKGPDKMQADLDEVLGIIRMHFENLRQQSHQNTARLLTTSVVDESHVFGRETARQEIMNMTSDADNVSIIPILGTVGAGKTTLAQLVYNIKPDPFHLKMWVCVNQDFDVTTITSSIMEEAANGEIPSGLRNLNSLQLRLIEILENKKFLLVLDDLWHDNPEDLDLLLRPLRHGLKGSKIIVTTRSRQAVSSLQGATESYDLKCLSDKDCWLILKRQAYGDVHLKIDPKLEAIGKEIARKCKGFPLGATHLGSLLRRNKNEEAWKNILNKQIWSAENAAVGVLKSRFCDHLPSHLKECFAYCSIFPAGHDLEKDKLVRMCMGEGFIVPSRENSGTSSLEQFFNMTIFELGVENYKMNQAVQDLALVVYGEKFFRKESTADTSISTNTRYLSLMCDEIHRETFEASYKCKGLRTFLLFTKPDICFKEVPSFMKLGRLRVLDLSSSKLEKLDTSIGNLKHLRFFDLSSTCITFLPKEIKELLLLQTLRLVNCLELLCLPEGVSKLKSLQHLELGRNSRLTGMPTGIGNLTALQTLSEFIVCREGGQLSELKDMNNIRGSLCIKRLEWVSNPDDAREANLCEKSIEELELRWTYAVDARKDELVLGNLMSGPHYSLRRLALQKYAGRIFPGWVSDKSSSLTSIILKDCGFCTVLPPLGQLPNLKLLKIEGMDELTVVDNHFCGEPHGFKALETLEFRSMPKLLKWTGLRVGDMVQLRELVIAKCPEINSLPALHYLLSLEKLEFESCPRLQSFPELSSSIEYVAITNCTILEDRCKQGGADWTKIERIPDVEIDYEMIQR